ncbi:MAG: hypothetical protein ABEH47_05545 [Haloferacaceae archaeon]
MFGTTALLTATKAVTLALGALITYLAAKAYLRTGATALRSLALGFALVTLGALLGGLLHQTGTEFALSQHVQSLFTAAGFAVLVHSLYADASDAGVDRAPSRVVGTSIDED